MNRSLGQKIRNVWQADFFSPKYFLRWAVFLTVPFVVAHLCGLRESTSILNGTSAVGMNLQQTAFWGGLYVLLYLAFILLVPTLLLAAGLLLVWHRVTMTKSPAHESEKNSPTPDQERR